MYNIMNYGEKHIACVLLVDVSGSMSGDAINELNEGLRVFGEALKSDSKAYGCADVCVISFGSKVEQVVPFCPAAEYVMCMNSVRPSMDLPDLPASSYSPTIS